MLKIGTLFFAVTVAGSALAQQSGGQNPIPYVLLYERLPPHQVGTVASAEEICAIFNHPIFGFDPAQIRNAGLVAGIYANWGHDSASEFLQSRVRQLIPTKHFEPIDYPYGWQPDAKTSGAVLTQFDRCITRLSEEKFQVISRLFIRDIATDKNPRILRMHGRVQKTTVSDTHFLAMITLKEAHPVLKKQLDQAEARIAAKLAAADKAAGAEQEAIRVWQEYKSKLSLLEKVFNYTSHVTEEGTAASYWVSGDNGQHKCIMSLREQRLDIFASPPVRETEVTTVVDLRQIRMQGFRIQRMRSEGYYGNDRVTFYPPREWWRVGDEKTWVRGHADAVLERVEKAWVLAFRECPGVASPF